MQTNLVLVTEEFQQEEKRNWKEEAKIVLDFLNLKAERRYKPKDVNLNFIIARLKEGSTVQECKSIIAMKCREWKGDPVMNKYLRPATLFNATKHAQYEGELGDID